MKKWVLVVVGVVLAAAALVLSGMQLHAFRQKLARARLIDGAHFDRIKEGMSREAIDKAIAKYADTETLYDQPEVDKNKARVTGPFTVEAVPAAAFGVPEVRKIAPIDWEDQKALPGMDDGSYLQPDPSLSRSGETLSATSTRVPSRCWRWV